MKRLMLSVAVVVLFLTGLFAMGECATSAVVLANDEFSRNLNDDPNDPEPERAVWQAITYLDEDTQDPNDPEPECIFIGTQVNCLDDDPNDPEPERVLSS